MDTLPRAVDSELGQTVDDWELIVIDDGSPDETPQFLAGISDPRIVVCRHSENRGVTAAKNTGLDHIGGDWFTTFDSDDEMMPDALRVMLECAERTGVNAITCNCIDSATGEMTGLGPTQDGRLSAAEAARCRGDRWGLTKTSLLGEMRFDERLPGREGVGVVWLTINLVARRYYILRGLARVHTEGNDRVTVANRKAGIRTRIRHLLLLGENSACLYALRSADPRE